MNIDFEDWLTPTINSKSVIGKILTNKYYYNNLEIKGNQLGPVVLFYNDEKPIFFQNEISQPVIFDNVEILSKEEIKNIIKQEYSIENFDIEYKGKCQLDHQNVFEALNENYPCFIAQIISFATST